MAALISARRLPLAVRSNVRAFSTSLPKQASLESVKYTAKAKGSGGRNGKAEILGAEPGLKVDLAMPKELGGSGKGLNPEQLFSLGYSACFLGAMNLAAKGKVPAEVTVETQTSIGKPEGQEGFGIGLKVIVRGEGSGVKQADLEKYVKAGHEVCPYSRATRGNIDVEFEVVA